MLLCYYNLKNFKPLVSTSILQISATSHSSVIFLSSSGKYLFVLSWYSGFQYGSLVKLFLVVQLEVRFGDTKLPLFVYLHGGGFLIKSAFSPTYHAHLNVVVAEAGVITVSINYRLAP
ncbi:unnamed protein product [Coffea canephora]|uniref:Alpha/beta hydrolase fold-3 domain-containing protein n=1 Tax=Coffea canephora TaxID=49390 RepID=A0A068V5I4_COFCA|nr:unnamed protein product [Coffea canephora]